ncbi:V4R domain-containing protein [Tengunoibacter tsumagoiensis]|uniref:Uncharacterized protein n=1 Tax=Tengunoibacter tsumagoiensis TaxID=2014871 RepID=A0A401ZX62_9CHLR|nr:V4R domain-containing protein [Tengunoibacter tsumagoiensis]GCE11434.1 hypothetical protein KTT_12930 [Tengunoibacter tsumagoiensis]
MKFPAQQTPLALSFDPLARAREHVILIIDADEIRQQRLASLVTLAGMRAFVANNIYQAFERYLQEHFQPHIILLGQQEEAANPLFPRFYQRLIQDLRRETPIMPLANLHLPDGNLLMADETMSSVTHRVSKAASRFLHVLWEYLPDAQFSLIPPEHALVLDKLPEWGLAPRIARKRRSSSQHFQQQLKAARRTLSAEQWELLLPDVGLAQFRTDESLIAEKFTIPPEYTTCLCRAVMFADPIQPVEQINKWIENIDAEILQRATLIFLMQRVPKMIGQDLTLRTLLTTLANEINALRDEKMVEWKRLEDGSFVVVFYSTLFSYGLMGASGPSCFVWQTTFEKVLELGKVRQHWQVQEIECSAQTHTGHCVFHLKPA